MNIKAVFIGINRHQDPAISELRGATRDATALWSLFTDTIDNLIGRLLLDENATYRNVSEAIFDTLSSTTQ